MTLFEVALFMLKERTTLSQKSWPKKLWYRGLDSDNIPTIVFQMTGCCLSIFPHVDT